MAARVDYIIIEGNEWVKDPSKRYALALEYREALITLMPRLYAQVMSDIPTSFNLEPGHLERVDTPVIPGDVIREALANLCMHRDYKVHQPTQIIRYSNRLEFKNAGYSLKSVEDFSESGSKARNPIIAGVFHELKYAETKGTGIGSMQKWMKKAGLTTPPIIESDRAGNQFDLILLPHHLLDHAALVWLSQFQSLNLSDAQRRALAFVREIGAITNQDYRQLNAADTLTASAGLRKLREADLLVQKGKGNATYYVLSEKVLSGVNKYNILIAGTPDIEPGASDIEPGASDIEPGASDIEPGASDIEPGASDMKLKNTGLNAVPEGFPKIPSALKQKILDLKHRSFNWEEMREIIMGLCSLAPLTKQQLSEILDRNEEHLRKRYLSKMIQSKDLVYVFDDPTHFQQAYKTNIEKQ
jgi:ATP-dependent DNA helicase RecG